MVRSYRYKLTAVDDCGNESDFSESHLTMHLTMNLGLNGVINLIWNHYEGFDVPTYNIWRWSDIHGWKKIASLPANLTSYTDYNPPTGDITYYVEVEKPGGCTITELKAGTLNSSKSNRQSRLKTKSTVSVDFTQSWSGLQVYPNPTNGIFTVELFDEDVDNLTIELYDSRGVLFLNDLINSSGSIIRSEVDISSAPSGVYHLKVTAKDRTTVRKIILE
jgi:hypothetical protein